KKRRRTSKKSQPTREEPTSATPPRGSRLSPDTTADADSTTSPVIKEVIPTDKKIGFLGLGIMGVPMA
uniref:6-phosphogluconate dehydrogenase NADP-binding domain-containing protein n=1 Tax=Ciona savignyi TaxID=51511 RepID=H2YMD1_CIOSA